MADDEICRICGEPKSAHVATEKGPLTHPREARGEGTYVLKAAGSYGMGLNCSSCGGPCGHHVWEEYEFKPSGEARP